VKTPKYELLTSSAYTVQTSAFYSVPIYFLLPVLNYVVVIITDLTTLFILEDANNDLYIHIFTSSFTFLYIFVLPVCNLMVFLGCIFASI